MQEDVDTTSQLYRFGHVVFDRFMTHSPAMVACLRLAKMAGTNDLSVLITGETGTGKNLLAQAIHNASERREKPCVVVNCTALTETLMESELFGHEKGAFTGADKVRKGRFELADGGTLVLDEIGDMSLAAQAKILRAVEYGQFERLGGQQTLQVDVRVVAMTNCDLHSLVAEKRFRQDLLYRLQELHIEVPPLRARFEDLDLLCQIMLHDCGAKFQKTLTGVTPEAQAVLRSHGWPGNLRELKAVLRRAAALAEGQRIEAQDLGLRSQPEGAAPGRAPQDFSLQAAERWQIVRVLKHTGGNKRQSARLLQIARNTLDKKIADYGIDLAETASKAQGDS